MHLCFLRHFTCLEDATRLHASFYILKQNNASAWIIFPMNMFVGEWKPSIGVSDR